MECCVEGKIPQMISVSVLKGREERKNDPLLLFSFIFITVFYCTFRPSVYFIYFMSFPVVGKPGDVMKQKVKQTFTLVA